jgi:hypothetical protein
MSEKGMGASVELLHATKKNGLRVARALVCLFVGSLLGVWMFDVYTSTYVLQTSIVVSSIGLIILGFFAVSTAITLHAIARLPQKLKN